MDSTLIAGIIGGIATIGAVIISPIAQKYFEKKNYPIDENRRKLLNGIWGGMVTQIINERETKQFNVDLTLEVKGNHIEGSGIINSDKIYHVKLDGAFRNDRFLKMNYENKDPNIIQFGCFIFHLADDTKALTGRFVGYGHHSKIIIHGSCEFKKI